MKTMWLYISKQKQQRKCNFKNRKWLKERVASETLIPALMTPTVSASVFLQHELTHSATPLSLTWGWVSILFPGLFSSLQTALPHLLISKSVFKAVWLLSTQTSAVEGRVTGRGDFMQALRHTLWPHLRSPTMSYPAWLHCVWLWNSWLK